MTSRSYPSAPTARKAGKAPTPTSKAGRSSSGRHASARKVLGRSGNGQSGFTLVELVIVMVILGVAAGLVIPRITPGFTRSDTRSGMRRIARTISEARAQAVLTGRMWAAVFDFDEARIWAEEREPGVDYEDMEDAVGFDWRSYMDEERPVRPKLSSNPLPDGMTLKAVRIMGREESLTGRAYVRFQARGLGEPAWIVLEQEDGAELTMVVPALAGELELHEGDRRPEPTEAEIAASRLPGWSRAAREESDEREDLF